MLHLANVKLDAGTPDLESQSYFIQSMPCKEFIQAIKPKQPTKRLLLSGMDSDSEPGHQLLQVQVRPSEVFCSVPKVSSATLFHNVAHVNKDSESVPLAQAVDRILKAGTQFAFESE
jgi:hypothetical protein